MADFTPNFRASYEAEVTTPLPPSPPTTTGLARNVGSLSTSTDA